MTTDFLKMTLVDKYTSSYFNDYILYQEYARYDHIYQAYASISQINDTLVYFRYMQRHCQFNLAILTAKNLAYVGHTSRYKNQQIPM